MEHDWNVSVAEATRIQEKLRDAVRIEPLAKSVEVIAGADVSFGRFSDHFFACVVVLSLPDLAVIETSYADMRVSFPYVPGYLSFREVPVIAKAYAKLRTKPDALLMDGHGIAHPRRLGVASHLGIVINVPTIGCAKSLLFGEGDAPSLRRGGVSKLVDPKDGSPIGAFVRTKDNVNPIIVSPGHRVALEQSIEIALATVRRHRSPEPTRIAHNLVNAYRTAKTP